MRHPRHLGHVGVAFARPIALALLALTVAACSVEETTVPPLAGPSELALGIVVHATPDSILQDGVSQSFITIEAKGPDGRPVNNVGLRLAIAANGIVSDFGTLSTKTTTTDDNGRAKVTYTAPPKPIESVGTGTLVTIIVTPIGSDFRGEVDRVVDIRVIPPGVILPPNGAPVPAFTISPQPATVFATVTFDASATADEGVACGARCTYNWTFGDGATANGMVTSHEFRVAGSFNVTLTVIDARGQAASVSQTLTVSPAQPPTAAFAFSPTEPLPGQMIFFNASASRAAPGRSIVSYAWDFGSGATGQGVTISRSYSVAGSYAVTLNVTDDANQVGTFSQTVPVGVVTAPPAASKVP